MLARNVLSLTIRTTATRNILLRSRRTTLGIRKLTNSAVEPPTSQVTRDEVHILEQTQDAWLFVDSVFPIRLGIWEYALVTYCSTLLSLTSLSLNN
jgi:hypothetical protein